MTEWELHGEEFLNCNCVYGCPCQFNALPSNGFCQATSFFRIDKGYFGAVLIDGLNMAWAVRWPGPIHQGHGQMQPIIDEKAAAEQRNALLSIMTGKETAPMTTFWAVFTAMCEKIHDPIYAKFAIDLDMNARRADCKAEDALTGRGEPILNPVTGDEHRVGIVLPNGFEYGQNEVGRGWSKSSGAVAIEMKDSYAHWCELHFNQNGRIQ